MHRHIKLQVTNITMCV